ncbi:MAG: 1-(5-phosphoribosyl)-5-[(5-phosphoribosylamino)methylideneamino]imidazole-4-carboxamide isomerase [Anaerolineae bacterium]|nr:1-(5-phosphoribosyl)-5-[(5-phosphoribosylamino)methylideneamino]imidazole-4-carboxamide isomerase [Anaerolineae bacterium]
MIIYPAIDLRGGRVVRLREGDPTRQTVFSDDPVAMARHWIDQGAQWLHVVNLDGAFAAANDNSAILREIAALGVPVQFGGGLRSLEDITAAKDAGATRVILGTIAVQQPDVVDQALALYGADSICVALDSRDGYVTTHGWQQATALTTVALGEQMAGRGVIHCLYTDVARDGGLEGVNREATIELARATGLHVIASGGVSSLDDVRALAASGVVAGAIIGMALYEGKIELAQALEAAGDGDAG